MAKVNLVCWTALLRILIESQLLCGVSAIPTQRHTVASSGIDDELGLHQRALRLRKHSPTQRAASLLQSHKSLVRFAKSGPKFGSVGFDTDGQDQSVPPGDDFFTYANGKYIENLQMPGDQSSWGSFDILSRQSQERCRGILEDDASKGGKMGKFYASYMNKSLVDELDIKPVKPMLEKVKAIKDHTDFAKLSGKPGSFYPAPFGIGISADSKDVNSYCVTLDQAGLGLPRDYYLKDTFAAQRASYLKYIEKMLDMADWSDHGKASAEILALETKMANASWSASELRDPIKNYNLVADANALHKKAPGFNWTVFLKEAGDLPRSSKLVVGAIGGVIGIAEIIGKTDIGVLRSWAAFHLISSLASILSERFVKESFKFSQAMSGQKEQSPRWKRAVNSVNAHMGEAVGQVFVQKFFPASSKLKVEGLTQELKKAFRKRLQNLDWMTDATKKKAIKKLDMFSIQVGYPKKFRRYDELRVDEKDLFGNIERSLAADWQRDLNRLGKPVDKDEWAMNPQTVNAYNMPNFNEVVFPAAVLQPPFFDPEADMAVNYGGIGGVIGHEMTHGFDDSGRHYNEHGQLEDWWTDDDAKEFQRRAGAYDQQFVEFDLQVPGAHVKPNLTTGEDIADLGGLTLALEAYSSHVAAKACSFDEHLPQCYGLVSTHASTKDECQSECCVDVSCSVWQYNVSWGPKACWMGSSSDCTGPLLSFGGRKKEKQNTASFLASRQYPNKELAPGAGPDVRDGVKLVFFGWAQVWRSKTLRETLLSQLAGDPHPPARARVDIPCRNLAAWYDAFGVQKGKKNYLPEEQRIKIW